MTLPRASAILRLLAFAVPSVLGMAGVQPLLAAASGSVHLPWAITLAGPALAGAILVFVAGRAFDHGDSVQPPWYTAWLLLPGAFLLAGAAAMCIFGALIEFALVASTMWFLLISGSVTWGAAMVLVRTGSR